MPASNLFKANTCKSRAGRKLLRRSSRHTLLFRLLWVLRACCSCPNALVTSNMTPARNLGSCVSGLVNYRVTLTKLFQQFAMFCLRAWFAWSSAVITATFLARSLKDNPIGSALKLCLAHVFFENESKLVLFVMITNTSVISRTLVAKIEMTKTRWEYKSVESSFSC